jgi:hypothetical protein
MTTQNSEKTYTLEDLNYFWTKSGVPCFMADKIGIEEIIESLGFTIYYLIANVAQDRNIETKTWVAGKQVTNTSVVTDLNTSIVKVVSNFVGRSVQEVDSEDIYDFDIIRTEAVYNLPAIPKIIIDKLDEFFRLVEAQHGTESIVMLTFDPNFQGSSEGWGVLVPDQQNTAVHCKYDPDSIVYQKPEHVIIVGSVHSHPNMPAYASGTDHADQADFDGIHITYGWQKSVNNGATQYHIEMQIGGTIWTLKPEDVFEDVLFLKDPDPEVIEWSQKVKKVYPPQGGSVITPLAPNTQHTQTPPHTSLPYTSQTAYTPAGTTNLAIGDSSLQIYPVPPKDSNHIVVAEISISDTVYDIDCPSCESAIVGYGTEFVCATCDMLLCLDSDIYSDIIESVEKYLTIRNMSTDVNIYVWTKDDNNSDVLLLIKNYNIIDANEDSEYMILDKDSNETSYLLDDYFYEGFDHSKTVCCNELIASLNNNVCDCINPVYYTQVLEFDQSHPYNVYDSSSSCADCEYYYSRSCTPYLVSILDHARNGKALASQIKECNLYLPCQTSYSQDSYERG